MAESLDVSALNTALGEYAREQKEELFLGILNGDDILANRMLVPMEAKSEVPLPRMDISAFLKPRVNEDFAGTTGALDFDARILKVRKIKGDLKIIPDTMRDSWLQLLATNKIKPGELPFEQFILDAIVKGANRDIVENALFKGTYNDAGTTPAATLTGFMTTALADVPTGYKYDVAAALSSSNIIDAMDATYDKLHEKQKNNPKVKAFVSPAIQKMYARAVRDTYNTTISEVVDGKRKWFIYDTDVEIVSEIGLAGSDHILITDTDNMCVGFDNKLDSSSITIQPFDRYLKVMLDFEMGVQFREVTNGRVALSYDAA